MISINNVALFNHKIKKNGLPLQKVTEDNVLIFGNVRKQLKMSHIPNFLTINCSFFFLSICSTISSINVFHFHWENMSCIFILITVCIVILSMNAKYCMLITYNVSFDQGGHQWLTAHDQILAWLQHCRHWLWFLGGLL